MAKRNHADAESGAVAGHPVRYVWLRPGRKWNGTVPNVGDALDTTGLPRLQIERLVASGLVGLRSDPSAR